jgi:hypothetical protein
MRGRGVAKKNTRNEKDKKQSENHFTKNKKQSINKTYKNKRGKCG